MTNRMNGCWSAEVDRLRPYLRLPGQQPCPLVSKLFDRQHSELPLCENKRKIAIHQKLQSKCEMHEKREDEKSLNRVEISYLKQDGKCFYITRAYKTMQAIQFLWQLQLLTSLNWIKNLYGTLMNFDNNMWRGQPVNWQQAIFVQLTGSRQYLCSWLAADNICGVDWHQKIYVQLTGRRQYLCNWLESGNICAVYLQQAIFVQLTGRRQNEQNSCLKFPHIFPYLRWMTRKMKPRTMQIDPTTRYAMPRKGFFPPSHEVVDRMTRFDPLNDQVGYAANEFHKEYYWVIFHVCIDSIKNVITL